MLVRVPFAFLFALAGLPLIYNILMSFQEVDMFSLGSFIRPFVGIDNYVALFQQPETLPILTNTLIFVVGSIAGQFIIGFGLALFFWTSFPGSSWLRGLFLVSWVMPGLVVGAAHPLPRIGRQPCRLGGVAAHSRHFQAVDAVGCRGAVAVDVAHAATDLTERRLIEAWEPDLPAQLTHTASLADEDAARR